MKKKIETIQNILEYLTALQCFKCKYHEECSSEYPEYLIKCNYIEKWVVEMYNKMKGENRGKKKD